MSIENIQSIIDAYKAGIAEKSKGGTIIYLNPFNEETQTDLYNAYHIGIYEQATEKIKLHPMSEEPERYRRFIILNDKYEPIESDCISELAVYCEVAKYTDEWMSIAPTPKAKSWAYADELSRLIKNNTAPFGAFLMGA